jgi:regulator of protease activity HflC (stomatin/prohibitin superfamily)
LVGLIVFAILAVIVGLVARQFKVKRGESAPPQRKLIFRVAAGVAALFGAIALICGVSASVYTQTPGEAVVQRDTITGKVVGQTTSEGLYFKAPWVDTVMFNIRNQPVSFAGDAATGFSDNSGGSADGAQITVQDKEGVSSNIDITLRYSIKAESVTDVYRYYKDEENFKSSFITQDIRSVVRTVPGQFSTLDLITKRGEVEKKILDALEKRWVKDGVVIDSISLQEIRVPESVREAYASAQESQINVEKERANLEAAEVKAQQKVKNATAEAEANRIVAESLTDSVLRQRSLDTLAQLGDKGNVIVVPDNFTGLGNLQR